MTKNRKNSHKNWQKLTKNDLKLTKNDIKLTKNDLKLLLGPDFFFKSGFYFLPLGWKIKKKIFLFLKSGLKTKNKSKKLIRSRTKMNFLRYNFLLKFFEVFKGFIINLFEYFSKNIILKQQKIKTYVKQRYGISKL